MNPHHPFLAQLGRASRHAQPVDADAITETIERALASGGLDTRSVTATRVTETIQRALSAAGFEVGAAGAHRHGAPSARTILAPESVERASDVGERPLLPRVSRSRSGAHPREAPPTVAEPRGAGQFLSRSFINHAGSRAYKLYVPASYAGQAVPMVVMLHGCTQSPDDFAAGTGMNELAEQHGFLVAYPAQAAKANKSKCWNWFESDDQGRDRGEPAVIAGITREIAANYRVDERRIFVAGLSAGAAMAVILGATYPDLYAAVGVHSGLPYRVAHDLQSALAAMHDGAPVRPNQLRKHRRPQEVAPFIPTIVFHGDQDFTVNAQNGAAIVADAASRQDISNDGSLRVEIQRGTSRGRGYTRTKYLDEAGRPVVEHWTLHGAGHAWSGGSPSGSFTDANGPSASAEMIRFFYSQVPG